VGLLFVYEQETTEPASYPAFRQTVLGAANI